MTDEVTQVVSTLPTLPAALRPGRRVRVTLELRQHPFGDPGTVHAFIIGDDDDVATLSPDDLDRLIANGHLEVLMHQWQRGDIGILPDGSAAYLHAEPYSAEPWRGLHDDLWYGHDLDGVLVPAKVVPA